MTISLPLDPINPPKTISREDLYSLKDHPNADRQISESDEVDDFVLELDDEDLDEEELNSTMIFYCFESDDVILSVGFDHQNGVTRIADDATFF